MISPFLKRLLFARQFFMIDGKIEILGKKQVMLPSDVVSCLQNNDPKEVYTNIKSTISKDIEDYAKKLGSSGEGMLRNIEDIFGTFGLGKLEVVDLDYKSKKGVIRIHNPPLDDIKKINSGFQVTPAVLAGVFSFLFSKEINAQQAKQSIKGTGYHEYILK